MKLLDGLHQVVGGQNQHGLVSEPIQNQPGGKPDARRSIASNRLGENLMRLKLRKLLRDLFTELLGSHDEGALDGEHVPHTFGGCAE